MVKQKASTGERPNAATGVPQAGLRRAGGERPGLSCNLGAGRVDRVRGCLRAGTQGGEGADSSGRDVSAGSLVLPVPPHTCPRLPSRVSASPGSAP